MLIRVVDLETSGFEPPEAEVCEIGWADVVSRREDLAGRPTDWCVSTPHASLVRPSRPIPPTASAIHHICDEDFDDASLSWPDICTAMALVSSGYCGLGGDPPVAFAAHNAKFERLWIVDDITRGKPWICTYKCALRLFPDAPAHSNQALRYFLRPPALIRDHAREAHRAGPDVYVTAHLLALMLEQAPIESLIEWSSQPALQVRCHIGKWRGTPWREVDDGFLYWILGKDFDEDVIFTVKHELARREKERADGAAADGEIAF